MAHKNSKLASSSIIIAEKFSLIYLLMSKLKNISFTATFNEIKNIKKLILEIKRYNPNVDILIVDDNSPDKVIG